MLFYFIASLMFLDFIAIFAPNKLKLNLETAISHKKAQNLLFSILPKTLTSQREKEYELLKKLEGQVADIVHGKSTKTLEDENFKTALKECLRTNKDLSTHCKKLFFIPNLYNPNNETIDGNIFNIINSFNAYQECLKNILDFLNLLENDKIPENLD